MDKKLPVLKVPLTFHQLCSLNTAVCIYVNAIATISPTLSFPCYVHSLFPKSVPLFLHW